jgi:hypothetical protein
VSPGRALGSAIPRSTWPSLEALDKEIIFFRNSLSNALPRALNKEKKLIKNLCHMLVELKRLSTFKI